MKQNVKTTPPDGKKDPAFYLCAPEISIFVACCVMINELHGLDRALSAGELSRSAYAEQYKVALDRLAEAVDATQRFDVVIPVKGPGQFSPFFWSWFNWWDDYLKQLTPSRIAEVERQAREHSSLVKDLRPKGDWLGYRSTPAPGL